jgi:hypothetical protein
MEGTASDSHHDIFFSGLITKAPVTVLYGLLHVGGNATLPHHRLHLLTDSLQCLIIPDVQLTHFRLYNGLNAIIFQESLVSIGRHHKTWRYGEIQHIGQFAKRGHLAAG